MNIRIQNSSLGLPSNAVVEVNASFLKRRPYAASALLPKQLALPELKESELLGQCMSSFIAQMHQRAHPKKLIASRDRVFSCLLKQQSFNKLDRTHLKLTLSLLPSCDVMRLSPRSLKTLQLYVPEEKGRLQALRVRGHLRKGDEKALMFQLIHERNCLNDLSFWLSLEEQACLRLLNTRVSREFLSEFLGLRPLTMARLGEFRVADFVFHQPVIENLRMASVIMGWSIKSQAALRLLKERRLDNIVAGVEEKGLLNAWQELRLMVKSELSRPGMFRSKEKVSQLYLPLLKCFNQELSDIDRSAESIARENHYMRNIEDAVTGANLKDGLKQLFLIGDVLKCLFPFAPDLSRLKQVARKIETR